MIAHERRLVASPIHHRGPWKGFDGVELDTLEWVDWHNHRRLHSACHDLTPAEYELIHYGQHPALTETGVSTTRVSGHAGGFTVESSWD
jgi:hypothetical protein